MSPEERCAYLKAAHEKYKDGLLQAEPAVFRCIVNKFPRQYADYARDRCIFHDRLIAAGVSRRFFTFQDAYNYSTVEAPWIDVGMSGSREQRIARLQAMYSNGAEIDIKYLSGLHRSE